MTNLIRYAGLLTVACALLLTSFETGAEEGGWLERWLWNPKERTRAAIDSMDQGLSMEAIEPLETALRLEPDSAVARYNAGTARLEAEQSGALALLQASTLSEQPAEGPEARALLDLLPAAHYNLGNARMREDDFTGAIEAFKSTLLLDSGYEDAKFNLELAQRRLEEQQEQQEQQGDDESEQEQEQEQEQNQQEQDQQAPPPEGESDKDQDGSEQERQSPLPQFRDLPDMSAEEAAAILEAVENMEREQRRAEAQKAARKNARGKKDW